jgi:signal transduction histidine kinase
MNDRSVARLAWLAFALVTTLLVVGLLFLLIPPSAAGTAVKGDSVGTFLFSVVMFPFPLVGVLISSRQPRNRIAWIFLLIGAFWGWAAFSGGYASFGLVTHPGSLPRPDVAAALTAWLWVPGIGLPGTFLLLLFPDGRLPSPRWKPLAWLCVVALTLPPFPMIFSGRFLADSGFPHLRNPLLIESLRPILTPLVFLIPLIPICILGCGVSLVLRFRRSTGIERIQLKWLTAAGAGVAGFFFLMMALSLPSIFAGAATPSWLGFFGAVAPFSFALIPVAAGFAILKHRLYDIDVVINKTVVFGALAAFITLVYVAIVVGIGHAIGSGDKPNLALSILATAVVAIAFQPVRERVQHFANRLVYGKRASPYEVLAEFSGRVAETYATEDVLPKMARTVAEGTGAAHVEVWLRWHDQLRSAASWPEELLDISEALPFTAGQLPSFDGIDKAIAVRHQGELLGALTVTKPAGEPLTSAEERLLSDLASQAGLVLRNVGLTAELLARLEELKASRQRLVTAQDQERRRLERNLHDGAQQNLVALKMRLALAQRLTERDPANAEDLIADLERQADDALNTLRDFARGIYPPLLAERGLGAALEAHAHKTPMPVEVYAEGLSRYPQEIEAAVYFCCLEALQNVAKYADASRTTVMLQGRDGELAFSVTDDGRGFDPTTTAKGSGTQNMVDRFEALEGSVIVSSAAGMGTTVSGSLPVRVPEPVA